MATEKLSVKSLNAEINSHMYILNLNIQCLTNKIDELSILLKDGKYDVITLTETWMTNEILLSINIPGYKVSAHYCRQNLKHGGVAILLKSNQNYKKLQIAEKLVEDLHFEVAVVELPMIIVVATYRSPKANDAIFF